MGACFLWEKRGEIQLIVLAHGQLPFREVKKGQGFAFYRSLIDQHAARWFLPWFIEKRSYRQNFKY